VPDITLGHLLLLAGVADALVAAMRGGAAARHQGHTPRTPQYARERMYRRNALLVLGSAVLLGLVGLLTWDVVLIEGGA
jgi:hypothetical protein